MGGVRRLEGGPSAFTARGAFPAAAQGGVSGAVGLPHPTSAQPQLTSGVQRGAGQWGGRLHLYPQVGRAGGLWGQS